MAPSRRARARDVHRGVAAAVDDDPAAEVGCFAAGDVAQHAQSVEDPGRVAGRDVGALAQLRADGEERRVEAAVAQRRVAGRSPRVLSSSVTPMSTIRAISSVEDVAGQPVGRDAVPHHAAGLVAGVADRHVVTEQRQVVRGREPGRAGADDEHPLARRRRRRPAPSSPGAGPRRRGTARPR